MSYKEEYSNIENGSEVRLLLMYLSFIIKNIIED